MTGKASLADAVKCTVFSLQVEQQPASSVFLQLFPLYPVGLSRPIPTGNWCPNTGSSCHIPYSLPPHSRQSAAAAPELALHGYLVSGILPIQKRSSSLSVATKYFRSSRLSISSRWWSISPHRLWARRFSLKGDGLFRIQGLGPLYFGPRLSSCHTSKGRTLTADLPAARENQAVILPSIASWMHWSEAAAIPLYLRLHPVTAPV